LYHDSLSFKYLPVGSNSRSIKEKISKGTPEHIINFMYFIAEELREIMAQFRIQEL
jgi:glutamate synthase domain-containing protein 2